MTMSKSDIQQGHGKEDTNVKTQAPNNDCGTIRIESKTNWNTKLSTNVLTS